MQMSQSELPDLGASFKACVTYNLNLLFKESNSGGWGVGDRVLGWRQGLCVGLRVIGGCAWRQGRVLRGGGRLGVGSWWSVGSVCARACHA